MSTNSPKIRILTYGKPRTLWDRVKWTLGMEGAWFEPNLYQVIRTDNEKTIVQELEGVYYDVTHKTENNQHNPNLGGGGRTYPQYRDLLLHGNLQLREQ
jgi:hypothetical protein